LYYVFTALGEAAIRLGVLHNSGPGLNPPTSCPLAELPGPAKIKVS